MISGNSLWSCMMMLPKELKKKKNYRNRTKFIEGYANKKPHFLKMDHFFWRYHLFCLFLEISPSELLAFFISDLLIFFFFFFFFFCTVFSFAATHRVKKILFLHITQLLCLLCKAKARPTWKYSCLDNIYFQLKGQYVLEL